MLFKFKKKMISKRTLKAKNYRKTGVDKVWTKSIKFITS